ncbi:DNA-binding transcriptional LysR family regulator [Mobilisporobacter senegalensis]|uniref:DNA-binding transcriptional LysR family regulator n=1 Tax=Mobilisporobacter senegalensis TaxID=1329262 RepID=A0A3N1XLC5_9FIRM|nr:LysR family transcriptional regulator [Mobilisporobacter senegalensis]ROR27525.1 DNA-binding transcriptional LysR family regulator [Mobilisporobacter senegalensis]
MEQNLSLYHIFNTVAETGNISKAAKELYISQPAISKAISKLEQNLDIPLFIRNSRGVKLTDEGKVLYEHTRKAFDSLIKGEDTIRKINELEIGHIRIGVSTTLCKYILLPYLKKFIKDNPHIKISISCQSTFHTMKLLEENKIDIGLIGKPDNLKELDFYSIDEIEDVFVATKTYVENLKLRELNDHADIFQTANILLLDEENITRHYIDDYFYRNNIQINNALEISNMDLLIEFARIGLGIACVIKDFVKKDLASGTLIEIPLDFPIQKREIGFAYSNKAVLSNSMEKFIQFYKKGLTH